MSSKRGLTWVRRGALGLMVVLLLGAGILVARSRNSFSDARVVPSRYYAKEYCSCLFVLGFSEEYCRKEVKEFLPYRTLETDFTLKAVRATAFGREATAKYLGGREGCRLQ